MLGLPTNADEAGLRGWPPGPGKKVVVKLFLRHPLHAKLYLLFRPDPVSPRVGYLGSSNLTMAGLSQQGELNIDVLDQDAWPSSPVVRGPLGRPLVHRHLEGAGRNHRGELGTGGPALPHLPQDGVPPLQEARAGLAVPHPQGLRQHALRIPDRRRQDRRQPPEQTGRCAHRRRRRPGQNAHGHGGRPDPRERPGPRNLILCPKNLVPMWEDYRQRYRLREKSSISQASNELPNLDVSPRPDRREP